jgi:SAM-dependent methyltransferase
MDQIQEGQYEFPYHYIPHFTKDGQPRRHRHLNWGLEYLCYQHYSAERILDLKPQAVLDVGCGDGYLLGLLKNRVHECHGVDFSDKAISFARAFHPEASFHTEMPEQGSKNFDVVSVVEVLEHVPTEELDEFIQGLFKQIPIGRYLVVSVPSTSQPLNQKHYRHFSKESLCRAIESAYESCEAIRVEDICSIPALVRAYLAITMNRFWVVEVSFITSLIWTYVWKRRRARADNKGRHIFAVFKKTA